MEKDFQELMVNFKQSESELDRKVREIISTKLSEKTRNAFFDGPETTSFNRNKTNLEDTCNMIKGFKMGIMMYLENEQESKLFLNLKKEFTTFFKENFDIKIKTFKYVKFSNPGGSSHHLIISKNI